MKVLIAEPDDYSEKALESYRGLGEVSADKKLNREELLSAVKNADILVIRLAHKIDKELLNAALNLKFIVSPTTGLDHIDLEYARQKNIDVVSLRGEADFLNSVTATAELAWGLLLALARKIPAAFDSVKTGKWDRDSFKGAELRGKTLGVIGCGRLGKICVQYGNAFLMDVLAYDPHISQEEIERSGAEPATMEELLRRSDFVSVHVPLDGNEKLLGEKEFGLMKDEACLINTSRGAVIDEDALLAALKTGKIAGAAIDVMAGEDADGEFLRNNPLPEYAKNNNNLIIVPHLGGATLDSMKKTEDFIAQKLKSILAEK